MRLNTHDTIAAISTPIGEGGIAVIRVSGKQAFAIVNACFKGKSLDQVPSHTLHYGKIHHHERIIDEVLCAVLQAPHTYTGEHTVEISCHGGVLITQQVLETVLAQGARPAEPGEFTYRAFLNGKMELSQAEAVADLIHAKSKKAIDAAHQQLEGRLGDHIRSFRQQIIDATAMIELELDFTEEDVEFASRDQLKQLLTDVTLALSTLLDTYETGRIVKDGVKTVFVGAPNAGKSTLLNTLVGKERAIVTEIAGTTRDTIDADWSYEGLLFRLIDTAGIRETVDVVEAEGVRRSQKAMQEADLIVYLKDVSEPLSSEEMKAIRTYQQSAGETPFLLIGTKTDRPAHDFHDRLSFDLTISAKENLHIDALKKKMKERALANKHYDASSLLVTSSRHRDALEKARIHVLHALDALEMNVAGDFLAIDLRAALQALALVTGEVSNEEILGSIFSRFCIGK